MANYELRVRTTNYTKREVYESDLILAFGGKEAFVSQLLPTLEAEISAKTVQEFAARGYTVDVTNFYFNPTWEIRQAPSIAFPHNLVNIVKLNLVIDYSVYSEVQVSSSPLPLWVMPIVDKVLYAAVVAFLGAITVWLVIDWLKSMTLLINTVDEYGWVTNPDTGEAEWKLLSTTTKKGADYGGIILVAAAFLVLAFLLLMFQGGGSTVSVGGKSAGVRTRKR